MRCHERGITRVPNLVQQNEGARLAYYEESIPRVCKPFFCIAKVPSLKLDLNFERFAN